MTPNKIKGPPDPEIMAPNSKERYTILYRVTDERGEVPTLSDEISIGLYDGMANERLIYHLGIVAICSVVVILYSHSFVLISQEVSRFPHDPPTLTTELKSPRLYPSQKQTQSGHAVVSNKLDSSIIRLHSKTFHDTVTNIARPFLEPPQSCSRQLALRAKNNTQHIYKSPLKGFIYIKVPKAASSTLAGINTRIAIRQGRRTYKSRQHNLCTHKENHIIEPARYYGNLQRNESFLWASIREPSARALSRIFFWHISQGKRYNSTDQSILHLLRTATDRQLGAISKGQGGFQLQYLSFEPIKPWSAWTDDQPTIIQQPEQTLRLVRQVIDTYDFIAITERMDESLVAMQLLRGLVSQRVSHV